MKAFSVVLLMSLVTASTTYAQEIVFDKNSTYGSMEVRLGDLTKANIDAINKIAVQPATYATVIDKDGTTYECASESISSSDDSIDYNLFVTFAMTGDQRCDISAESVKAWAEKVKQELNAKVPSVVVGDFLPNVR